MANELTTTGNQLSTLSRQLTEVTDQLAPASDNLIASRLLSMRNSGLDWPSGIDPNAAVKIYTFALGRVSNEALKRVVQRIIKGEHPEHTRFIPRPPELAAMVRREAAPMVEDSARIRAIRDALTPSGETLDPVERERQVDRIREMHADFMAKRAAQKAEAEALKPAMSEAEASRLFRNKEFHAEQPRGEKWDDVKWHKQQEEMEHGNKAQSGPEGEDRSGNADRLEGRESGDDGDGSF